jgi:hypothetical protein
MRLANAVSESKNFFKINEREAIDGCDRHVSRNKTIYLLNVIVNLFFSYPDTAHCFSIIRK